EAEHGPALALLQRLREEDAIFPDNGRRVAPLRQRRLPAHVVGAAPGERHVLLGGNPIAVGPAPARPVAGQRQPRTGGDEERSTQKAHHGTGPLFLDLAAGTLW